MRYYKRLKVYKASHVEFDPINLNAYSYGWWRFLAVVDGKLIFNNFPYSRATMRHQGLVRRLLSDLNIKIDIEMPIPSGINSNYLFDELVVIAEEYLCSEYLESEAKREKRNERARLRRIQRKQQNIALISHAAHESHSSQMSMLKLVGGE